MHTGSELRFVYKFVLPGAMFGAVGALSMSCVMCFSGASQAHAFREHDTEIEEMRYVSAAPELDREFGRNAGCVHAVVQAGMGAA